MKLNIVIPCYNEEAVLRETNSHMLTLVDSCLQEGLAESCDVIYVDDGSNDRTWDMIKELQQSVDYVHGIKLAHNVGHQNALWAGYMYSVDKCDAVVSVDADLQQDIWKIKDMLKAYNDGCEIVYGVRNNRGTDSGFKKRTAGAFYGLMRKMGVDLIPNHADFRLVGKKALKALSEYPERNLFLRGLVRTLGFKETIVYFDCGDRLAGKSKYTFAKMFGLATDGITSFSVQPLHVISLMGFFIMFLSIVFGIYSIVAYFCGQTVRGWTSLLTVISFFGGVQMLCIGVLGEYIGKIYKEVKRRPLYIIESAI